MQREGVFREMKLRRSYEKPSERKARERAEAVRRHRKLLHSRDHSVADGLKYVATWNSAMLLSTDLEESVMAMMKKRPPEFKD